MKNELINWNEIIEKDLKEKGFSLYNWISFDELRESVNLDYLYILNKINIFFWILFVLAGIIDFYSYRETWTTLYLFVYVLLIGYFFVFLWMIIQMLIKSSLFIKITNVVFTDTHIWIWHKLVKYEDSDKIQNDLKDWSKTFQEESNKKSNLKEKIKTYKDKVFNWDLWKWVDFWDFDWLGKEWAIFWLVVILFVFLYWIFLFFFYYVWYFITFFLSHIFVFIMKIILFFSNKIEIKINSKFEELHDYSKIIDSKKNTLFWYIEKAKTWYFEQGTNNIWNLFPDFMKTLQNAMNLSNDLYSLLKKSVYQSVFDFEKYDRWITIQIKSPALEMINLLKKTQKDYLIWIEKLENQISKTEDMQYKWPLELQLSQMKNYLPFIEKQIIDWNEFLLKFWIIDSLNLKSNNQIDSWKKDLELKVKEKNS